MASETSETKSYIRFLHAAPSYHSIDIYINGLPIAYDLSYKSFTDYFEANADTYHYAIYRAGDISRPVKEGNINLINGKIYTAALAGEPGNTDIELITDKPRISSPDTAYIRFINLSPDAPSLSVYVDGTLYFTSFYREVSSYFILPPGSHEIIIREKEGGNILFQQTAVAKSGDYYGGYIVGYYEGNPPIDMLIPIEGATFLRF